MTIFGIDLASITEGLYLGIEFTDNHKDFDIVVNPKNITYIIGKTVIINTFSYPKKNIEGLLQNRCRVISRVWIDDERILYDPYKVRINMGIMWNGEVIETLGEENLVESGVYFSMDSGVLFFPKIRAYRDRLGVKGEANYLGYLLHQVGQCIFKDCPYQDLDIIKAKKGIPTF